jgi:hypothetical protein
MNDPVRGPAHAAPKDRTRGVSRRGLLLAGAAVVAAAGGGVSVAALRPVAEPDKPTGRPPADLVAALNSERALIAAIDATTGGSPAVRTSLRQVRADHVAHQVALQAAVDAYPESPAGNPSSPGAVAALTVAGLRNAEAQASAQAATRAARLTGRQAALLASIAACESSHAVLFA